MSDSLFVETKYGAYSKSASITRDSLETCDVCKSVGPVLAIDTSGEEYALLQICGACCARLLDPDEPMSSPHAPSS